MTCASDNLVVPVFVPRTWIVQHLGLSMKEVRRIDEEGLIERHPGFAKPVKYYGWSIRKFMEGK